MGDARMLAVRTAAESPGDYGRNFREVTMVFEVVESGEDADYYNITLSFRPQGNFAGTPGQEQFVIGQDGTIVLRQVLSTPRRSGNFPVLPVGIGLLVVGAIVVVGAVFALSGSGGDGVPIAVVPPTEAPVPTETPAPTETPTPIEQTVNIEKTVEVGVQQRLTVTTTTTPTTTTSTSSGETTLTSSGLSFKFQYACINRTMKPCELMAEPGGLVDKIKERTNGQVEIEISSFPELGLSGQDTLRLIEDGTLEMAEIYSGYVGGDYPSIDATNLWGLIPDNDVNLDVIDAVRDPVSADMLDRFGAVVIGESYYPNSYYFSSKPLQSVGDFAGSKIRTHSAVLTDLLAGMGADPQYVAFSEVYVALERGILDAAVSCGWCGARQRWFEWSDYLVGPIAGLGVSYISVNENLWNEIPSDLQAIILEETEAHSAKNRRLATNEWEVDGIADNVAGGMEYIELTSEIKAALKRASMERVVPNWVDRVGGVDSDAVRMYNTYVAPLLGVGIDVNGRAVEY